MDPLSLHVATIEGLESDWRRLAEAGRNLFMSWEWALVWWRRFGRGEPLVFDVRDSLGTTVAVLPLHITRRGRLRLARMIGHGPADELGPVCAQGDLRGPEALAAAVEGTMLDGSLFVAERFPGGKGWADRLGARVLRHEASPVVSVPRGGWDEFLDSRSANLRQQLRRKERRLGGHYSVEFRLCDDPARLDRDMNALIALHRGRWGSRGSGALEEARASFHRDFARVALERGWLRLWMLEADGEAIAAWYGFRFGNAEWYYQSGRDPAWDRWSVGFVLLAHTMREAMRDGVTDYRLLRGGEAYKDRFASGDSGVQTLAVARGASAQTALIAASGMLRLPGPARRIAVRTLG